VSEVLGAIAGGGLGSRLSDLADAIIDPFVAIITLMVFAILLPLIVQIFGQVSQTSQTLTGIQQQLAQSPVGQTPAGQVGQSALGFLSNPLVQGIAYLAPGGYYLYQGFTGAVSQTPSTAQPQQPPVYQTPTTTTGGVTLGSVYGT
jgi:hypothetical protein